MTSNQWSDLSGDTADAIDEWRSRLRFMIAALRNLESWKPDSLPGDEVIGQEEPNTTWDGNESLFNLMQLRATQWSESLGQTYMDWCTDCLRVLNGWGTAFTRDPHNAAFDVKATQDLAACKRRLQPFLRFCS